jgi:hypothetical protein
MNVCDLAGSYVWFVKGDLSYSARIQFESRCEVTSREGTSEEWFLTAACIGEEVFVEKGLFMMPIWEWRAIFSRDNYHIFWAYARAEENRISRGVSKEHFPDVRIDLAFAEAELLPTNEAIVQATLANRPLLARTELAAPSGETKITLDYPVKIMNVNAESNSFQVDTGPLAFWDWTTEPGSEGRLKLAYVAFNRFDWAEFALRVPTPILEGGEHVATVNHYSEVRALPVRNSVLALKV